MKRIIVFVGLIIGICLVLSICWYLAAFMLEDTGKPEPQHLAVFSLFRCLLAVCLSLLLGMVGIGLVLWWRKAGKIAAKWCVVLCCLGVSAGAANVAWGESLEELTWRDLPQAIRAAKARVDMLTGLQKEPDCYWEVRHITLEDYSSQGKTRQPEWEPFAVTGDTTFWFKRRICK